MAKLTRVLQKIFGLNGATSEFGQIGSEAAGTPTTTKDLATMQSLSQFLGGLYDLTNDANEPPRIQDINALYFLFTSQLKYLFQNGIPEWIATENYYANISFCQIAGTIYQALTGTDASPNIGHNPASDTTNWANVTAAAARYFGEYLVETKLIPDTTNKKITFTNKQTGKVFSITETRAPEGTTCEATHSLGAVAGGIDYVFDFSMHNYSGAMKGVLHLSVFNDDEKVPIYFVLTRRPTGSSGYGTTEDYYMARLSESGRLEINTGGEPGATPTFSEVLTEADRADFATAAQGTKADNAMAASFFSGGVAGTYGSQVIDASSYWVPPAGLYIMSTSISGVSLQIYNGSSWVGGGSPAGSMLLLDGVNYRIYNSSAAITLYYRKLY